MHFNIQLISIFFLKKVHHAKKLSAKKLQRSKFLKNISHFIFSEATDQWRYSYKATVFNKCFPKTLTAKIKQLISKIPLFNCY